MKQWYEYYSLKQMYEDWRKEHNPIQFVKYLQNEKEYPVYDDWKKYIKVREQLNDIDIQYSQGTHYKYHHDNENIKPLAMGRGPLPENNQLEQSNAMNKTVNQRPQYQKFVNQLIAQYKNNHHSDREILKDLQSGLIYNQNYGISQFIRLLALHSVQINKIKSAAFLVAKRIYDKLHSGPQVQFVSLQKIKETLNNYIDKQVGEN